MAEAPKFNLRNPAVKRIMQEIKEIKQDTSGDILAEALETDIFEWHFVIRGPRDTEFEGGIYHGRILLPADYPFKPPSFMMLTPNGRFETNVKICLSISSHHPEHWQPSWSVRTALTALIAFMPSPGAGALGALAPNSPLQDFPKEERRLLAARSRAEVPRFGSAERQRVIDDMHARMLAMPGSAAAAQQAAVIAPTPAAAAAEKAPAGAGGELAGSQQPQQPAPAAEGDASGSAGQRAGGVEASGAGSFAAGVPALQPAGAAATGAAEAAGAVSSPAAHQPCAPSKEPTSSQANASTSAPQPHAPCCPPSSSSSSPALAASTAPAAPAAAARLCTDHSHNHSPAAASAIRRPQPPSTPAHTTTTTRPTTASAVHAPGGTAAAAARAATGGGGLTSTDHMLTALMWALYVGIGAILLRKVMGAMGVDLAELMRQ
ncbi:hypothetical protein Agub_g984 [Astrephomene gubernaculifera]|uniref:UBC core domain-containing protein n=1 Tax=Astrephomene gubernaculifera TaxID=47775 RepID=A0AAD3DEP4_9CHLO|nr:hypothetical protein Agub_g984 [Astrephomene gubernaculifera]